MSIVNLRIKTDDIYLQTMYKEKQNYITDAGFDLYCPERIVCIGHEKTTIDLGIKLEVVSKSQHIESYITLEGGKRLDESVKYEYTHYLMLPRSSFSHSTLLLCNSVGVIDKEYRGSLKAVVYNFERQNYIIEKGDRLFQLIFPTFQHIDGIELVDNLSVTHRNEGGFGSTGR